MLTPILPTDAARLLDAGQAVLVDVREANEFATRHIPSALSRPLSLADASPLMCGSDVEVIFTCQTGRRTAANAGRLAAMVPALASSGRARVLEGGVDGWAKAGLALSGTEAGLPLPIMRQVQIAAGLLVLAGVLLAATVAPGFIALSAFVGAGLTFAGVSGWCGMAELLTRMPWNRRAAAPAAPVAA